MFHHGLRANILLVVLVCREYGERQQGKTENNEKKFQHAHRILLRYFAWRFLMNMKLELKYTGGFRLR
jgi:hypothetical protein